MKSRRSVFISGGGPAGLAAALLFEQLGWDEIVVVERRSSPSDFEKNKSFNYLIDLRGQRLLQRLGIAERLRHCGVDTREFTATTITPEGEAQTRTVPIIDPDRPTCYWTTRRAFLTMLFDAIKERASDRIRLLYSHNVTEFDRSEQGNIRVRVEDRVGGALAFAPDLILACDGLNSAIRSALAEQPEVAPGYFDMVTGSSISTGLRYKVLNLPARFTAAGGRAQVADNRMSFVIPSRHTALRKACALFAFPVVDPSHPRSVNLIREADHELWTLTSAEALLDWLEDAFPQLDVRSIVPHEEAAEFVELDAGAFPAPQYASHLRATLGPEGAATEVLLIGDAAHAFPPDLGLGVNSALQDVDVLAQHLGERDDLHEACRSYAAERLPEARDLAWMVEKTFPAQYNHRPLKLKLWVAGFLLRRMLNRLVPSLFDKPAFLLSQDPDMSYGEMRRRKERTDARVRLLGLSLAIAIFGGLLFWLT